MKHSKPYQDRKDPLVAPELEALSPLLAKVSKPEVPLPGEGYFSSLGDVLVDKVQVAPISITKPKPILKLWPMAAASLAAAASIAIAIIFWPVSDANNETSLAWDTVSDDALMQYALQEDIDAAIMEDAALISDLEDEEAFQYLAPNTQNEEYNKLLLEQIDEETFMEDIL